MLLSVLILAQVLLPLAYDLGVFIGGYCVIMMIIDVWIAFEIARS